MSLFAQDLKKSLASGC